MATLGSRLYGCSVSGSDRNYVKVCSPSQADVTNGDVDLLLVKDNGLADRKKETTALYSPKTFIEQCVAGQPKALELAFLPKDCLQWEDSSGLMMTEWIRAKCKTQTILNNYASLIVANEIKLRQVFDPKLFCDTLRYVEQAEWLAGVGKGKFDPRPSGRLPEFLWGVRRDRVTQIEAMQVLSSSIADLNLIDVSHLKVGISSIEVDDIIARVHQDCIAKG